MAWRAALAAALMFASGFAGLGYQLVWTEQSALALGHEAAAVLAVVSAFFGGLALGGLALGPRIEASRRPVAWYAGLEVCIALWASTLSFSERGFYAALAGVAPANATPGAACVLAFASTFVLLLPATLAMGATLPAVERLCATRVRDARSVSVLYASNTAGAVLGALCSAFWLLPTVGLRRTTLACAALNVLCALFALSLFPGVGLSSPDVKAVDPSRRRDAAFRLAARGLLGIGYEVLAVRVLAEVTEDTVYTFALLLAVYLAGTALGAAVYRRVLEGRRAARVLGDALLSGLAATCLVSGLGLWQADDLKQRLTEVLGGSMTGALATEAALAFAVFALPTFLMGALFSHLARAARSAGLSFGRALGINTLGAAAAPAMFGVGALPWLGAKVTLVSIVAGYLALVSRARFGAARVWGTALAAVGVVLLAPPLRFVTVPRGGHVVSYEAGVTAAVSVVADADGVLRLRIDNREQEGSSATRYVDARQAWLPLLLHPAPHRVLFLGLGTGVTARSAAEDPTLEVDAVELVPEVVAAARRFANAEDAPSLERLRVVEADARRYVRTAATRYDVIVSDNFHPARSGSGALYTAEHFASVRERLAPGGVFCQWLPLHQLDLRTLRSIVHAFVTVMPNAFALLANNSLETPVLGLVMRAASGPLEPAVVERRIQTAAVHERLERLGLDETLAVLGSFVGGPSALREFAGDAPSNTDDRPIVAYRAPRATYAPSERPADRLVELLGGISLESQELLGTGDGAWAERLAAYWAARNRFIAAGREVRPSGDAAAMLAQVREPLLSVLRISPEFRPAYDPLLSMASALARSDAATARVLLAELARLQPNRGEASRLLALLREDEASGARP